jgi:hypothetical protein
MTLKDALRDYTRARRALATHEREHIGVYEKDIALRADITTSEDVLKKAVRAAKRGIVGRYFTVLFTPKAKREVSPDTLRAMLGEQAEFYIVRTETVDAVELGKAIKRGDYPGITEIPYDVTPMTPAVTIRENVKLGVVG